MVPGSRHGDILDAIRTDGDIPDVEASRLPSRDSPSSSGSRPPTRLVVLPTAAGEAPPESAESGEAAETPETPETPESVEA